MINIQKITQKMEEEYNKLDGAHDFEHIKEVIGNAVMINSRYGKPYAEDIVIVAALYHDIGNTVDRKNHHIESAKRVMEDSELRKIYDYNTRYLISKACEEHRASYRGEFTSTLSKIINDADSMAGGRDIESMIERSLTYTRAKNINDTQEMIYEKVYGHLVEKFGREGYQKYRLDVSNELCNVEEIYKVLESKETFKEKYIEVERRLGI